MALPRTFVGFSSKDLWAYWLMCALKEHEHIDFNFCDCQLQGALNSTNENYIKQRCRERLDMAGTYVMLIGNDTRWKTDYVKWEAEVAIEKECRLIGVNLDNWRYRNDVTCPPVMMNAKAVFLPFSPQIVQYALEDWKRPADATIFGYYYYQDWVYTKLGYVLDGNIAKRPPKPNPWDELSPLLSATGLRLAIRFGLACGLNEQGGIIHHHHRIRVDGRTGATPCCDCGL